MKSNVIALVFIFTSLFSATFAACTSSTCGASSCCDDALRGTICYDPIGYSCATDQFNGKSYLCGKGTQSCSGTCFDANNYACSSGTIVQKSRDPVVTPTSTSSSTSRSSTTSSSSSSTSSTTKATSQTTSTSAKPQTTTVAVPTPSDSACGNLVCSGTQSCCNGQCYETQSYQCVRDSFLSKSQLCPKGNFGSCNGGCFDSTFYHCENGRLVYGQAPSSQQQVSTSETSKSSTTSSSSSSTSSTTKATSQAASTSSTSSTAQVPSSTSGASIIVNPVPVPSAPTLNSCGTQSCYYCCNSQCYDPLVYGCSNDNGKQYLCPAVKESNPSSFWVGGITHNGIAAFNDDPQGYKVYRNVKDFGAKGDGKTDDTVAINAAITAYGRCGQGCDSSTVKPALVFFPTGTYLISSPIIQYYFTQLVGDALQLPTILAAPGFSGMAMIDSNPYSNTGNNWYTNQNNFYRQIRNFIMDTTLVSAASGATCIHWQVAQATSISNVVFKMSTVNGNSHQGIWMENGSGGFMSDLVFYGGKFGMWVGNQQFTSRNLTFEGCQTAIYMNWNWGWTFKSLFINNCGIGMDMSSSASTGQLVASVVIIDSVIKNTKRGIITGTTATTQPTTSGSLSLDNVNFVSVAQPVSSPSGANLVSSSSGNTYVSSWGQGRYYGSGKNSQFAQGNLQSAPTKPASLLTSSGSFFERPKPQYERYQISDFVNVKTLGAKGDGKTDDTAVLSAIFLKYAGCKIVFIPHGTYLVSDTVLIPSGSRIVGEAWSQLMATGDKFQNANSPKAVFKVGNQGDVGTAEISDIVFTTNGPVPGAILVEWNIRDPVGQQGACGMWDTHFRFGGAKGTKLQVGNCKAGKAPTPECMIAFMMLHLTSSSSAYLENVWAWTADHDLDGDGQISIYNARGLLCEATAGVWMYGTAVEHNVLYQYNFINSKNVFMAMIQTETPYYQGSPQAPAPVVSNAAYNDPDFSNCPSGSTSCAMSWGLRAVNSKSIFSYGAGLYAFFNNYSQKCLDDETCQDTMVQFQGSNSQIYLFGLNTKAAITMIQNNGVAQVAQSENRNTFCSTIHYVLN